MAFHGVWWQFYGCFNILCSGKVELNGFMSILLNKTLFYPERNFKNLFVITFLKFKKMSLWCS